MDTIHRQMIRFLSKYESVIVFLHVTQKGIKRCSSFSDGDRLE